MTVWAWDGRTLAADKQATNNGTKARVTKVFTHTKDNGTYLLTGCGDHGVLMSKIAWFKDNSAPWPKDEDKATLAVITPKGGLLLYESIWPMAIEEKFHAGGSGRDIALGAMAMGATAAQAVEIAITFETGCGMGIDTLELNNGVRPA